MPDTVRSGRVIRDSLTERTTKTLGAGFSAAGIVGEQIGQVLNPLHEWGSWVGPCHVSNRFRIVTRSCKRGSGGSEGLPMQFFLSQQVALTKDIPEKRPKRGDVATIVEHHPVSTGADGYSLEVFNAFATQ